MAANQVSIEQVKREISELVNRVASGGKPKAALVVSIQDYELLEQLTPGARRTRWTAWQQASEALTGQILARRQGEPIDVERLWQGRERNWKRRVSPPLVIDAGFAIVSIRF